MFVCVSGCVWCLCIEILHWLSAWVSFGVLSRAVLLMGTAVLNVYGLFFHVMIKMREITVDYSDSEVLTVRDGVLASF